MSILIRDAAYEPLRKCERATTFKVCNIIDGKEIYQPCAPSAPGARNMKMMDLNGD